MGRYIKTMNEWVENKDTYFVVRDTAHPEEDLKRNWSSYSSGSMSGESGGSTEEEARVNFANHIGVEPSDTEEYEFRFHPAYGEYVVVDYDGLGAFELEADNLEDAIIEADNYPDGLAVTIGSGTGHFYAEDVVSFHEVRSDRYVFEIKS